MLKRIIAFFLLGILAGPLSAQNICLSFDDAPTGDGLRYSGMERAETLINKFKKTGISPVIFCVPNKLDSARLWRLKAYSEAGIKLGNHTCTHGLIEEMGAKGFLRDIFKADSILSQFKSYRKIFRYPYLNEGKTAQTRDSIRNVLIENGFEFGYVTVDTYDWYINSLYQNALKEGKTIDYNVLRDLYIEHIWAGISFYDDIAKKVLGRSPNHVVLLHENDLAALFVDELIDFLKRKGCNFISPDEAYSDKIAYQGMSTLNNNQGKIGAIAKDLSYSGSIWPENEEEEFINKLFEERKAFR